MSKTKPIGSYKIFCTSCCTEARSITTTIGSIPKSLINVRHKNCGAIGQMVFVSSDLDIPEFRWQAFSIVGLASFIGGFMVALLVSAINK